MRLKICWKKQWRNKTVFILRNKEAHYDLLDECLKNDIEDVREVIAARDLNIRDDMGVSMPEHAVYAGNLEFVKMLIEADADVDAVDKDGKTVPGYVQEADKLFL